MDCNLEWISSFLVLYWRIFLMECTLCLLCQRLQKVILSLLVREGLVLRIRIGIFNLFDQNTYHRTNVKEEPLVNRFPCFRSFGKQLLFFKECLNDSFTQENESVWFCPSSKNCLLVEDFSRSMIHFLKRFLMKHFPQRHQHWIQAWLRDGGRQLRWGEERVYLISLKVYGKLSAC